MVTGKYDCPTCGEERKRFVPVALERDALRREVEALTKDRERLDWLSMDSNSENVCPGPEGGFDAWMSDCVTRVGRGFSIYREAVDIARQADTGEGWDDDAAMTDRGVEIGDRR